MCLLMPRLANIKPKQAIKAFAKAGFIPRKQTGSHFIMKNYQTNKMVRDIKVGLLRGLIGKADLKVNDF